jgi:hypothetical protein
MKQRRLPLLMLATTTAASIVLHAQNVPRLSDAEREEFLRTAKITKTKSAPKGITNTQRVTMTDVKITHDAHVQCIDESKREFKTDRGTEINFRDTYQFNIAAYRLARMLGIENVPVTVERRVSGTSCAVDWWVDDVKFDEATRRKEKRQAPDPAIWNNQMNVVRVFDQLIYNVDRNLQNLLILNNWDVVMIDHSRTFRTMHTLENPKNLTRIDRILLANLRAMDKRAVQQQLAPYVGKNEIEGVMARRDLIVKFFDNAIKSKGETAVLYDLQTIKSAAGVRQ